MERSVGPTVHSAVGPTRSQRNQNLDGEPACLTHGLVVSSNDASL
jgi:hypothetical protein